MDDNFEQWSASLRLLTLASNIQDFIDEKAKIDGMQLQGDDRKLFFSLANAMLISMSEKTRRIATAGYDDDEMKPALMLSRLSKHFNPMSNVSDIQLRRQLYGMRWSEGKNVATIANDIRFISNKINFIEKGRSGHPMGERELIAVLIMDAPLDYAAEVSHIERERNITFEAAVEMLQMRETRIQSGSSSSSSGSSGSISSAQIDKRKKPVCDTCGRDNHTTDKCFQNQRGRGGRGRSRGRGRGQRGRSRQNEAQADEVVDDIPILLMDEEEVEEVNITVRENPTGSIRNGREALIDSGCSRHACGKSFKSWLTDWRDGPTVTVKVADGSRYSSSRYASLPVQIDTDKGLKQIVIGEVLYIEELSNLLLSVGAMTAKGVEFAIAKGHMTMILPGGTVTVPKAMGENLYRLHVFPIDGTNAVHTDLLAFGLHTMEERIQIWHNAIGHPGKKNFIRLMSKGKIPRFRYSDVNRVISNCEACNLAKARAKKTPERTEHPATEPLERIHCDAVMIKHKTMGGSQGFSLIVDEFTKYVDVKLIRKKNETQGHIKEFILRMKALGHQVKRLRTDSAAEFAKDANFKKWLIDHLVTQENSAPYAQHQNGVAERHIQMIED